MMGKSDIPPRSIFFFEGKMVIERRMKIPGVYLCYPVVGSVQERHLWWMEFVASAYYVDLYGCSHKWLWATTFGITGYPSWFINIFGLTMGYYMKKIHAGCKLRWVLEKSLVQLSKKKKKRMKTRYSLSRALCFWEQRITISCLLYVCNVWNCIFGIFGILEMEGRMVGIFLMRWSCWHMSYSLRVVGFAFWHFKSLSFRGNEWDGGDYFLEWFAFHIRACRSTNIGHAYTWLVRVHELSLKWVHWMDTEAVVSVKASLLPCAKDREEEILGDRWCRSTLLNRICGWNVIPRRGKRFCFCCTLGKWVLLADSSVCKWDWLFSSGWLPV